ncbi:BCCT family transporter [Myroides sp. LJL119]
MSLFPRIRTTLSKGVILPSLLFIVGVSLLAATFPRATNDSLNLIKEFIFLNLNWVYVWSVTLFILFLVYLMFSKFGNIRLGPNNSKPEYSFFSWISMLFAAGMGIGLMYFSVAEPLGHYSADVFAGNPQGLRAQDAQMYTFFHWGIHPWAIYAVVGLALSYFAYRYRLPLSLRSCFYPLLKDKIKGKWGNLIDVFALCSTFFGITTTLGFGVIQINSGLQTLGLVSHSSFLYQAIIVITLVSLSVLSAVSGLDKGVKILSNINIIAVVVLLLFVLILGPTVYLISSFTQGIGVYISNFFELTFSTHSFDPQTKPWFYDWTILYWAWWISWAPYVGIFIAKISKGRTIREYIVAVLLIPTLFNFIWMSVFGNSAIWFDINQANGALSSLVANPEVLLFKFLEYLPLSQITSFISILIILIFFVTSADSGIYVMNSIATKNAKVSPKWQIIIWGVLLGALALLLLNVGGLDALQSMTLITALPFSIIMLLFMVSLAKALVVDQQYYAKDFEKTSVVWSGDRWKQRLKQIISFDNKQTIDQFIDSTVKHAFLELEQEFAKNNIEVKINSYESPKAMEIEIKHDQVNNFIYGVKTQAKTLADSLIQEENLPDVHHEKTYFPMSYFGDYRQGYDVQILNKNELISDVLKHYQRFIEIVAEDKSEMFITSNSNYHLK